MSQQKSDFIITNYDNFKDASLFIKQYFEAEKRMKDIQNFFQSFYMSKLIRSEDVYKLKPKYVVFGKYDTSHSWFDIIVDDDLYLSSYCISKFNRKNELKQEISHIGELLKEISTRLRNDWACYYILDANNILHEFIPIKAVDTIKVTFDKESIFITGHYFYGFQMNGDFGMAEEHISQVTKTIVIDPSNNNVLTVKTSVKHITTQKIKKHLGSHECYTHAWVNAAVDGDFDTFEYVNPYKQIKKYIEDNYANYYKGYICTVYFNSGHSGSYGPIYLVKNKKELESIYNDIIEHNKDIFKEVLGIELNKKHLSRYDDLFQLRSTAIKEAYKDINLTYGKMENIPENTYPLTLWYKCNTHKNLLEENGKENR